MFLRLALPLVFCLVKKRERKQIPLFRSDRGKKNIVPYFPWCIAPRKKIIVPRFPRCIAPRKKIIVPRFPRCIAPKRKVIIPLIELREGCPGLNGLIRRALGGVIMLCLPLPLVCYYRTAIYAYIYDYNNTAPDC